MKKIVSILVLVIVLVGCTSKQFFSEKVDVRDNAVLINLENKDGNFFVVFEKDSKKEVQAEFNYKSIDTESTHVRLNLNDGVTRVFEKTSENKFKEVCAVDVDSQEEKSYSECSADNLELAIELIDKYNTVVEGSKMKLEEIHEHITNLAEKEFEK